MSRDCGKMWKHQWGWKYQEGSGFGRVMEGVVEGLWRGLWKGWRRGYEGVARAVCRK